MSTESFKVFEFGNVQQQRAPLPWHIPARRLTGDYDGDGRAELVTYTVDETEWWLYYTLTGTLSRRGEFGFESVVPLDGN